MATQFAQVLDAKSLVLERPMQNDNNKTLVHTPHIPTDARLMPLTW